jgi:transcription initiation factor TFIIB
MRWQRGDCLRVRLYFGVRADVGWRVENKHFCVYFFEKYFGMLPHYPFSLCNSFIKTTKLIYLNVKSASLRGPNVLFSSPGHLDYSDGSVHIKIGVDTMSKKEVKTPQRLVDKCPECGSQNLVHDYDTGETVCGDCGLVLYEQMMDKGPEWRAFTQEEKASRSRVGVPTSYSVHDKGLSTAISQVDRDAFGRKLPLSTRLQMWRLRKWQIRSRVHSSIDRNLAQAMAELDRLSDKVYIPPPIKEKAAVVYRKALDKGLVRGRSIAAIAAAALYAACRGSGTPRTLREIAEASLVDKKDVARCYRLLLRELEVHMPIADPLT